MKIDSETIKPAIRVILADDHAIVRAGIRQFLEQAGDIQVITDREIEILSLVGKGLTNKVIGNNLKISDRTVQGHIARIFEKLQANSRTEGVMRGISLGLIHLPEELKENFITFDI